MSAGDPIANTVEERAALWLQERRYWKDWSREHQDSLDAWLEEDASHAVAYWRLAGGLERMERLQALRARSTAGTAGRLNDLRRMLPRLIAGLMVAAICVGALSAFYVRYYRADAPLVYSTGLGGHQIISLTDGSQIELNTNTMVRVEITPQHRHVGLEYGEAFFQIVHDKKHPFVVEADGHRITDLGTQFLARSEMGHLEVDLVEGRARVDVRGEASHSATLSPGDRAVVTADDLSITKHALNKIQEQLSWRRGMIVFDSARLADAASDLNRYNEQKIVIAGPGVGALTLSATVPANNVGLFIRSVRTLFNLQVQNRGNEIVISR
jgi:transmembrane sensor